MVDAITPQAQAALTMKSARPDMAEATAKLKDAGKAKDMRRIDEAAEEFEAMFLTEMLRPMFEGLEVNEEFGGGKGEEIFRGLMLEEYGKSMAASGGIGIAAHVKAEMIRLQEMKP